jgi:hypothetical protein
MFVMSLGGARLRAIAVVFVPHAPAKRPALILLIS